MSRRAVPAGSAHANSPAATPSVRTAAIAAFHRRSRSRVTSRRAGSRSATAQPSIHSRQPLACPVGAYQRTAARSRRSAEVRRPSRARSRARSPSAAYANAAATSFSLVEKWYSTSALLTPSAEATSAILTAATPRASICPTAARSISSRRSATLNRTLATRSP